jgi:AcrR family transcriptional regulator
MAVSENASARRRQVVSSAAELFDRDGYHTTNMAELAQAVGIGKPTLYHYFRSKDEILFWIHEECIDILIEKADARAQESLTPEEGLRFVMRDIISLLDTHPGHVRVFFEHQRELKGAARETIKQKRDYYEGIVKSLVTQGMSEGVFREMDPHLSALAIFSVCNWSYQWYRPGGRYSTDEIADFFFDLILNGLRPR